MPPYTLQDVLFVNVLAAAILARRRFAAATGACEDPLLESEHQLRLERLKAKAAVVSERYAGKIAVAAAVAAEDATAATEQAASAAAAAAAPPAAGEADMAPAGEADMAPADAGEAVAAPSGDAAHGPGAAVPVLATTVPAAEVAEQDERKEQPSMNKDEESNQKDVRSTVLLLLY
jgi:hypothetical protein